MVRYRIMYLQSYTRVFYKIFVFCKLTSIFSALISSFVTLHNHNLCVGPQHEVWLKNFNGLKSKLDKYVEANVRTKLHASLLQLIAYCIYNLMLLKKYHLNNR